MIRILDIVFSTIGILILMPVFFVIALLIKCYSKGPVFFKQSRVGLGGVDFDVLKFRTMHIDADKKGLLTVGGRDPRVTGIGYFLRKYKLDELPQLINVLKGSMSLVGPRPEVRKYVNLYSKEQLRVLSIRPGITDWASIQYKDENQILAKSLNPEETYIEEIIPKKIEYNLIYINQFTVTEYFRIVFYTILSVFTSFKLDKTS